MGLGIATVRLKSLKVVLDNKCKYPNTPTVAVSVCVQVPDVTSSLGPTEPAALAK